MIQAIIDYIKDLFDPSPIKCNRFALTKEQYEELQRIYVIKTSIHDIDIIRRKYHPIYR